MRIPHVLTVHGDKAVVVKHQPYESEAQLQRLLAEHPRLIPIPERRLLFLGSEVSNAAGMADLLYVDDDGLPTLVETKLLKNPGSRREVVGQVLDYAAALTEEWQTRGGRSVEDLVSDLRDRAIEFLGDEDGLEAWLASADRNLAQGRMRIILALDEAPGELVRLVRYLNDNSNLEVYLLEVRRFSAGDRIVLAPTLVGYKAPAASRPARSSGTRFENVAAVREAMAEAPEGLVLGSIRRTYFQILFEDEPKGHLHYEVWNFDRDGDGRRWLLVVLHLEIRKGKAAMLQAFEEQVEPERASFSAALGRDVARRDKTTLLMSVLAEPDAVDFSPQEAAAFVQRFVEVTRPSVERWAADCGLLSQ